MGRLWRSAEEGNASVPHVAGRLLVVLALLILVFPRTLPAAPAPAAGLVRLAGIEPDAVRTSAARRLAPLAPGQPVRLAIALTPRNERLLDAMLAAIYNPRSPAYHHYLTPETGRALFGPEPRAVGGLIAWLRSEGLRPQPWNGGTILSVTGTAAHIAAAFRVGLWRYRFPSAAAGAAIRAGGAAACRQNGARQEVTGAAIRPGACGAPTVQRAAAWRDALAPDGDPLLPARFAPLIRTIVGLTGTGRAVAQARLADATGGAGPSTGYLPDQIAAAYDFRPLYAAGLHGEGMRIALVELAPYDPVDIALYGQRFKVKPAIVDHTIDNGNINESPNVEATIDLELLSTAAPGATIDVYNAPNDIPSLGDPGTSLLDAYSTVADSKADQVLALTWVYCEMSIAGARGFVGAEQVIFKLLAVQGTTVLSASGDGGAYACSDPTRPGGPGDTTPAVVLPAADPHVLAVGGTDLTLSGQGAASTIAGEVAWSCSVAAHAECGQLGVKGGGSGGGLSKLFRTGDSYGDDLSWQTGPGVSNGYSNGYRQVPDVSFSGSFGISAAHEYSIFYHLDPKGWTTAGGTSTATPMWAALMALADQYMMQGGAPPLGWINPLLYQLGAAVQPFPPYHDIISGDNLLYPATPGWDFASGWGSPDARNLVCDLAAFNPVPPSTPTATPVIATATATAGPGASITATATIAAGTPTPSATGAPPAASPTASPCDVTATPTPSPTVTPVCPVVGIGNGGFETGTLVCWSTNGGLPPRVATAVHFKSRYSAQLGVERSSQRQASGIRQRFAVPPGLAHPVLHFSYWLGRSVPRAAHASAQCRSRCPAPPGAASPVVTVFGPGGKVLARVPFLPHRDHAWSGFKLALPGCGGTSCASVRLELAVEVPPQPRGVNEVLYLDDVYVGT